MHRAFAILLAAFCLASALPSASAAGDPAAPPLSTENATLYVHRSTADTDELVGWMNTLLADEGSDDTAMGPAAGCKNNPSGQAPVPLTGNQQVDDQLWGTPLDRTYTITLDPALAAPVGLDASKPIKASVAFGAGTCYGRPHIESTLALGTTTIATAAVDHTYSAGAPYPVVSFDMPLTASSLVPGASLVWTLHMTGTYYGAGFLGIGEPQGLTFLELPVTSAGPVMPDVVFETLTGDSVDKQLTFDQPTTRIYVYNWTTTLTDAEVSYDVAVENGTVVLIGSDAAGAEIYGVPVAVSGKDHIEVRGAKAGLWHVGLILNGFKGRVAFQIEPVGADHDDHPGPGGEGGEGGPTGGEGPGEGGDGDGSQSGEATDEAQGSPGFEVAFVVLAVAAVGLVLRRRT